MIIVRTGGLGINHKDERLELLKKMVEFYELDKIIFKLHDHKGDLSVYWFNNPSDENKNTLYSAWVFLKECNVYHYTVVINQKKV